MEFKTCIHCNIEQHISLYEKHDSGHRNVCKKCRLQQIQLKRKEKYTEIKINVLEKICKNCNILQPINSYNKHMINPDGYDHYCRNCNRIMRTKKETSINTNILSKYCYKCNSEKDVVNFKTNKLSLDGYYNTCNDCWKPREWTKEKERESHKKYALNNPEKIKEKYKRQAQNINRKLRSSMNKRITEALQSKKQYKTYAYLGCDLSYLKQWFEFQFEEGMNFDNYGEWHIDHVIPCNSFNFEIEENKFICFNWKNIRPCWAKENILKGNKILPELINTHNKKVEAFLKINALPTQPGDRVEGTE